jgi:hypothetical protein
MKALHLYPRFYLVTLTMMQVVLRGYMATEKVHLRQVKNTERRSKELKVEKRRIQSALHEFVHQKF